MMLEVRVRHRFRSFALDLELTTAGPVLGVFGASGSGKTTLLHAIAGLLRPQEGRIAVRVAGMGGHLVPAPGNLRHGSFPGFLSSLLRVGKQMDNLVLPLQ